MKKWYKKIDFIMIILVIILVIAFYCLAQIKVFHQKYINFCGYTIFRVITGSMADTIEPQDIVIVKITKDVEVGDIISFQSGEDIITHRVIDIKGNQLITKGDANNSNDSPIEQKDIIGKVIYIVNGVSILIKVIKTPQVIVALIFTIIIIKLLFFNNSSNKKIKTNINVEKIENKEDKESKDTKIEK